MSYYAMRTDHRLQRRELSRRLEHFEDFDRRARGDAGCGCGCGCNGKRKATPRVEVEARGTCAGAICAEQRDGRTWIHGLAHRFGTWSSTLCDLGDGRDCWREIIEPGAFTPALARSDIHVRVNLNHNDSLTLADYRNQPGDTADVWQDRKGLHFSFFLPETDLGETARTGILTGRLSGCSFRMGDIQSEWSIAANGEILRRIVRVGELLDVCLTETPAYVFAAPDPEPAVA